MGIDGNFAGGFAQGTDNLIANLRQDRRTAQKRDFEQKLINDERTANEEAARLNKKNLAIEKFGQGLFQIQAKQQNAGLERLQSLFSPDVSRFDQRAKNLNTALGKTQTNLQRLNSRAAGTLDRGQDPFGLQAGGAIPGQNSTAAFQQLINQDKQRLQRFGGELDLVNRNRQKLGSEISSRANEIRGSITIDDVLNGREAQILQKSLGLSDEDIAQFRSAQEAVPSRTLEEILGRSFELDVAQQQEQRAPLTAAQKIAGTQRLDKEFKGEELPNLIRATKDDLTRPAFQEQLQKQSAKTKQLSDTFINTLKRNPNRITPDQLAEVNVLARIASQLDEGAVARINADNPQDGKELTLRIALPIFTQSTEDDFRKLNKIFTDKEVEAIDKVADAQKSVDDLARQAAGSKNISEAGIGAISAANSRLEAAKKRLKEAEELSKVLENFKLNLNGAKNLFLKGKRFDPIINDFGSK